MPEEKEDNWGCAIIIVVFIVCYTAYEIAKLCVGVK